MMEKNIENENYVCLDANIWIAWLTPEENTEDIRKIITLFADEFEFFIAPSLLVFEVTSALRKKFKRGTLSPKKLEEGLETFFEMPLLLYQSQEYLARVFELAKQLDETVIYDVSYLALAAWKKAPFYTADRKLYEKAKRFYPDSHLV